MNGSPICVDARFLLRLLIPTETTPKAEALWARWHRERRELVAPTLLYYEVSNALHRYVLQGLASPSEAEALLDVALRLDLVLHDDPELHKHALKLAQRFSLPATYDAHYLALADRLGAELWTADRRLAAKVRDELRFVRLLGTF